MAAGVLKAADGALGSTGRLVRICYDEFNSLARAVLSRTGLKPAGGGTDEYR
jgi:hypothetical protein